MNLSKLLGRTITKIREAEFDWRGDGEIVEPVLELTLDNGEVVFLSANSGSDRGGFYATIGLSEGLKVGTGNDQDYELQCEPWKDVT